MHASLWAGSMWQIKDTSWSKGQSEGMLIRYTLQGHTPMTYFFQLDPTSGNFCHLPIIPWAGNQVFSSGPWSVSLWHSSKAVFKRKKSHWKRDGKYRNKMYLVKQHQEKRWPLRCWVAVRERCHELFVTPLMCWLHIENDKCISILYSLIFWNRRNSKPEAIKHCNFFLKNKIHTIYSDHVFPLSIFSQVLPPPHPPTHIFSFFPYSLLKRAQST